MYVSFMVYGLLGLRVYILQFCRCFKLFLEFLLGFIGFTISYSLGFRDLGLRFRVLG